MQNPKESQRAAPQDIAFYPSRPEDFDYFYNTRKETMQTYFRLSDNPWDDEKDLKWHHKSFDAGTVRLIHYKQQRVGCINIVSNEATIHIGEFCIAPAFQNQGIGTAVLSLVMQEADAGRKTIDLNVLKVNPALGLYERLGFERIEGPHPCLVYFKRSPQT